MYFTDSHPSIAIAESSVSVNNALCIAAWGIYGPMKDAFNQLSNNEIVFRPDFGKKKDGLLKMDHHLREL